MIAITVKNIKKFMNCLLLQDTFDHFLVSDASITTFTTFQMEGDLHPEFYESEQADAIREEGRTSILWSELKPFCLSVIRGKRTPLSFKFVFQLPQEEMALLLSKSGSALNPEDIFGLYFNSQFQNGTLTLTTGSSLRVFTMDHSLDHAWDRMLTDFLTQEDLID